MKVSVLGGGQEAGVWTELPERGAWPQTPPSGAVQRTPWSSGPATVAGRSHTSCTSGPDKTAAAWSPHPTFPTSSLPPASAGRGPQRAGQCAGPTWGRSFLLWPQSPLGPQHSGVCVQAPPLQTSASPGGQTHMPGPPPRWTHPLCVPRRHHTGVEACLPGQEPRARHGKAGRAECERRLAGRCAQVQVHPSQGGADPDTEGSLPWSGVGTRRSGDNDGCLADQGPQVWPGGGHRPPWCSFTGRGRKV